MKLEVDGLLFDDEQEYPNGQCADCGKRLSQKERKYYGYQCAPCVQDDHERLVAWRAGAEDPELDARYGGNPRALH